MSHVNGNGAHSQGVLNGTGGSHRPSPHPHASGGHPQAPRPRSRPHRLIAPHGGTLVQLWADPAQAEQIEREARGLRRVVLGRRQQADIELLANGAYSPLRGFMNRADLESVLEHARLASGVVWPIPIVLAVSDEIAASLAPGERIALGDEEGRLLGVLDLEDKYRLNHSDYARQIYRTEDPTHPGVQKLFETEAWLLGGPITVVRRPDTIEFPEYHLDPAETRTIIEASGWRTVVGFQTRNPIHRAHEFMLKSALEIFDAIMIQPLVGETRPSDIPAHVRLRCYEALLEGYYPKDRVFLTVLPAVMRFAGPREAVFHALMRKNYGCTHFIVGRDHAGVGNFYGPYDSQRIFDDFEPEEIGIQPLRFENTFYCNVCQGMASCRTCPHSPDNHLTLSGTRVREMLAQRELPPMEFTRPEVARILIEASARTGS
jgi:sulfate adenylyltransferase